MSPSGRLMPGTRRSARSTICRRMSRRISVGRPRRRATRRQPFTSCFWARRADDLCRQMQAARQAPGPQRDSGRRQQVARSTAAEAALEQLKGKCAAVGLGDFAVAFRPELRKTKTLTPSDHADVPG
ncbi:hypothetical protein MPL3356_60210 [Mesorhizobium plurifarium]|uniref:Uncharacterized protein n=1 Tax=Mesorhizobium plurifarium TaxID=69974 RepID=A0A090G4T6_MESPL|nr:hypothetical protein MPL3356_60210 [Mesorhizobium plurifarium]